MQLTGAILSAKRSVYTQNLNFGFAMDCAVDNTTGRYDFGVSGASGTINFTLDSGRILFGSAFLHSYAENERFYLECQVTPNQFNLLKNGYPLVYGESKTSGDYSYLYFSRANASLGADFNFYFSGQNTPEVNIAERGYLLTDDQASVSGQFNNLGSYPVYIFDSAAQATQDLDFGPLVGAISAGGSGQFAFTGDFTAFDFSQPILVDFSTNYGNANLTFSIIDARSLNRFVFLQGSNDFSFNSAGQLTRNLAYQNYSGGFLSYDYPANLVFRLEYASGSGQFSTPDFIDGANYSATLFGSFQQSGILTGQSSFATGNGDLSGQYIISLSRFGWATGAATGFFSGIATGIGSGVGYTGLAVGSITGLITGLIQDGSGTFAFNSLATETALNALSLNYPSYTNATGYVITSALSYNDTIYIGVESTPIIKGVQYSSETGLVYYLSGATEHKVNSYFSGGTVYLTSLFNGAAGNGIFVEPDSCNGGTLTYSPFLTGGVDIGSTGQTVVPISPFSGLFVQTITGSGSYSVSETGFADGTFYYTKTFTGQWDILTGIDSTNLISLKRAGNYSDTIISGGADFPANSTLAFQIVHIPNDFSSDSARLVISGAEVLNPISQILTN